MKLKVEEKKEAELEMIAEAWENLCKKCQVITPFQFPQWQIPWWKMFGGVPLKVLTIHNGNQLSGIALFFIYNENDKRKLCFVGTGISDYLDIISLPGYEMNVADSVLNYLADIRSQWDECDLQDIPDSSILLHCKYPDVFRIKRSDWSICTHLELPENLEKLRVSFPKKLRKNLSNSARKLCSKGGYYTIIADESNVELFLKELFELHQARWESKNQKGVLYSDAIKKFHKIASSKLIKSGQLRIYKMIHNEKTISMYYTLVQNRTVYAYLGGFDPSMEIYSPGALLLFHVIEDSLKKGAICFDFLRGNESYKKFWKPMFRVNYRIQLFKKE